QATNNTIIATIDSAGTKSRASRQRRRSDHALHSASGHAGQVNQLAVEKKCRKFSAAFACGCSRIARHVVKDSGERTARASGQLSATTSAAASVAARNGALRCGRHSGQAKCATI